MEVKVVSNQIDRALRDLKRKLIKEGLFREISKRKFYLKPSVRMKLKRKEAEKKRSKERKLLANRTF